jgi:drug/metabolite transporter (DMT)-like permease
LKRLSQETRAKLACAYSGLVWGLFWIPLRQLEKHGVPGLWANLVFYLSPLVLVIPLMAFRRRHTLQGGFDLQFKAVLSALSLMSYSIALLFTDVVRAILLFYLTPIWSALLARIILGDAITPVRWIAMVLGFAGLFVILNGGPEDLPLPTNIGDWLALLAGIGWAIAAVSLRMGRNPDAIELCCSNFIWSALFSLAFVRLFADTAGPTPALSSVLATLPWLIPTMLVVVVTGMYATMWGAPKLNPAVVGLLFMTEISVGAITAAIWAGETIGIREIVGIVLISAAGVTESLWDLWLRPLLKRA